MKFVIVLCLAVAQVTYGFETYGCAEDAAELVKVVAKHDVEAIIDVVEAVSAIKQAQAATILNIRAKANALREQASEASATCKENLEKDLSQLNEEVVRACNPRNEINNLNNKVKELTALRAIAAGVCSSSDPQAAINSVRTMAAQLHQEISSTAESLAKDNKECTTKAKSEQYEIIDKAAEKLANCQGITM